MKLHWSIVVAAALAIGVVGFVSGFNIRQPSLVVDQVREMRAAAEALDQIALETQRDPRNVNEQLRELREEARTIRPQARGDAVTARVAAIEEHLREQNDRLESAMWATHVKARNARERLDRALLGSANPLATAYDQIKRLLRWLGPVVATSILLVIGLILWPPSRRWLARAQSVNAGPFAINIHDPASVREGVRERFKQVDDAISAAYLDKLEGADVDSLFLQLKTNIDAKFKEVGIDLANLTHRATLWVPGFTGDELVQAARYRGHPAPPNRPVIGRRFSARYGIIGRAFRLRTSQYNWDVSNEANALVRNWGLTREEARKQGDQHNSLMAFVIPSPEQDKDPLGVVYLEADGTNKLLPAKPIAELEKRVASDTDGRLAADKFAQDMIWQPLWDENKVGALAAALINLRRALDWDFKVSPGDGR